MRGDTAGLGVGFSSISFAAAFSTSVCSCKGSDPGGGLLALDTAKSRSRVQASWSEAVDLEPCCGLDPTSVKRQRRVFKFSNFWVLFERKSSLGKAVGGDQGG